VRLKWVKLNQYREEETKEEFIKNLIEEYNEKCFDLFEINEDMIKEVEEV